MISALDAVLAELQAVLAEAQRRMFQPDVLPGWRLAAAGHVEVSMPDGAVLLTGAEGALPYEPDDGSTPALAPLAYQDYGMVATTGRGKAVAAFGPAHVTGWPAWVLWAGAHISSPDSGTA